jgi:hypothetical protein
MAIFLKDNCKGVNQQSKDALNLNNAHNLKPLISQYKNAEWQP